MLATQNPIEQEGTYPLPEAQLDRFMFNVVIEYPTADEERRILAMTTGDARAGDLRRSRAARRSSGCTRSSATCRPPTNVIDYAARLVRATRPGGRRGAPEFVGKWVRWGAGPRAGQALLLGAKARALLEGRSVVALEDVRASRCRCCATASW